MDFLLVLIELCEAAAVTSRKTVGWTSVMLSKWMSGKLIRYCPFPMVGAYIRSTGLKETSRYSEDELCIRCPN